MNDLSSAPRRPSLQPGSSPIDQPIDQRRLILFIIIRGIRQLTTIHAVRLIFAAPGHKRVFSPARQMTSARETSSPIGPEFATLPTV
jgi:hypothetical protein